MKESTLGRIRIVSIFECVPGQFELRELVAISTIADMNIFCPFLVNGSGFNPYKPPNKTCTGQAKFVAIFEHFSGFGFSGCPL